LRPAEIAAIIAWLQERCLPKSGGKHPIQRCTDKQLYAEYCRDIVAITRAINNGRTPNERLLAEGKAPKPRSLVVFNRVKRMAHVRRQTKYDSNFACIKCPQLPTAEMEVKKAERALRALLATGWHGRKKAKEDLKKAITKRDKIKAHIKAKDHQRQYQKDLVANLPADECVLLIDFSDYDLKRNVAAKDGPERCIDFVAVMETFVPANRPRHQYRMHFDFLSDNAGAQKNDSCYVEAALCTGITNGIFDGFSRVHFFSDGGPKHFKNVYGMLVARRWRSIWKKKRPELPVPELVWNFFASYHGHSLADSHASHVSQLLRREQSAAVHTQRTELAVIPSSAEAVGDLIQRKLVNCTSFTLARIPRPEVRTDLRSLAGGIKKFHQFRFPQEKSVVLCRELSADPSQGTWVKQIIVPK
jgi:hypothetical protein